jgi:acyl dehydratase
VNPELIGRVFPPTSPYLVGREKVREFARAVFADDPQHLDPVAAQALGYPDVVAPPTFAMVIDLETTNAAERLGFTPMIKLVRCDLRYLLHGTERYEYSGQLFAGDEITNTQEVLGFEDKKGGALEFCHVRASLTHPQRGEVVAIRRTFVHRLA